ncbi:hypothetical protein CU102_27570 [Phyllobacterium brassicacearum]|uniref:Uncharacterized protein n=1 Tax=Phyllobacterium brassicacearum TaxID=314235 RepID=A0A2P7B3H5_9HYPH|nr:hypothetical protein CU102_27570 [Phyllobacterium brassicacearum]TDQ12914.1 hypothetical protein DEV91_14421 [Phyllobacterium brassicacearum]
MFRRIETLLGALYDYLQTVSLFMSTMYSNTQAALLLYLLALLGGNYDDNAEDYFLRQCKRELGKFDGNL